MNGLQRFCREGVAWKHLRHPNILPLIGVTVSKQRFAMVSEWMENGNINEFVGKDKHVNRAKLVRDKYRLGSTWARLIYLYRPVGRRCERLEVHA